MTFEEQLEDVIRDYDELEVQRIDKIIEEEK